MCFSVSICDDRACPRLNVVTLSQRQRSLTPSESQSACWFFDIERGTDKATHQMSNDWENCRRNGFWYNAIYNLLPILCLNNSLKRVCVAAYYYLNISFLSISFVNISVRQTLKDLFLFFAISKMERLDSNKYCKATYEDVHCISTEMSTIRQLTTILV